MWYKICKSERQANLIIVREMLELTQPIPKGENIMITKRPYLCLIIILGFLFIFPCISMAHYAVIYEGENYTGSSYRVYGQAPTTNLWDLWRNSDGIKYSEAYGDRYNRSQFRYVEIKSISVNRTSSYVYTVFEGENYKGYCMVITTDVPSLRNYLLKNIRSLKMLPNCPENLTKRRFNLIVKNDAKKGLVGLKIRYRLKVDGRWQPWSNAIRPKNLESRSVDTKQIVSAEVEFLDEGFKTAWKQLSQRDLTWTKTNIATVKVSKSKILCEWD